MSEQVSYCVNHPHTETVLRCNRCGKPVCIKCVELTPVGYRCRECLGQQRQGYYNATAIDYAAAGIVGVILSALGGFVMGLLGAFWLLAIFAGPVGGGIVAEGMRAAVRRHRGRYLWLVACVVIVIGGLVGLAGFPLLAVIGAGRLALLSRLGAGLFLNLGFWIYLALAVSTAYARLKL